MNAVETAFLSLLRSAIWGELLHADPAVWNDRSFRRLAHRQSCGHLMSVLALDNNIAADDALQMKLAVYQVLQRQVRQDMLMTDLVRLLAEHGIDALVIKGFGLATLYPKRELRNYGDVDLYVGKELYHKATDVIKAAYPNDHWHSDTEGGIHFILVLDEQLDRIAEIHRVAMEFSDARADRAWQAFTDRHIRENAQNVRVNDTDVQMPGLFFNALYVFLHAWHHFESTGVGFRQLADWALCLHALAQVETPEQRQKHTEELRDVLNELGMLDIWQTFGYVAVHQLGLSEAEMPLYDERVARKAERLLKQLLRDGHGGREQTMRPSCLMHYFPYRRPEKNRLAQLAYTFTRLLFNFVQMSKLFPSFAWRECKAQMKKGGKRVLPL